MTKRVRKSNAFKSMAIIPGKEVEVYPYCYLPRNYFDRLIAEQENNNRDLLSIKTFDGRAILSVLV